jgi:class 3 adenylate cyclase
MLPVFVTEKIVALTIDQANELEDIDFNGVAATWEYSHAVVMFAKFHSNDPAFTPEAIDMTVQAVEQITRRFKVMKVKTIGSTIMLVAGIDDPRTRQEQLTGIVDAAIMIRACVFQQMNVPNLVHRIGVHCGPCFGAVIGGNGAIFDLFGDTVNTASRMMSSATAGAIQLSEQAHALLHPRLRDVVDADETVDLRGDNGAVYSVREPRGDVLNSLLLQDLATTPLNSRPTSGTPAGKMRRGVLSSPATNPFSKTSAVEAWRSTWAKGSMGGVFRPPSPVVDESHDLGPLLGGRIFETKHNDDNKGE